MVEISFLYKVNFESIEYGKILLHKTIFNYEHTGLDKEIKVYIKEILTKYKNENNLPIITKLLVSIIGISNAIIFTQKDADLFSLYINYSNKDPKRYYYIINGKKFYVDNIYTLDEQLEMDEQEEMLSDDD